MGNSVQVDVGGCRGEPLPGSLRRLRRAGNIAGNPTGRPPSPLKRESLVPLILQLEQSNLVESRWCLLNRVVRLYVQVYAY